MFMTTHFSCVSRFEPFAYFYYVTIIAATICDKSRLNAPAANNPTIRCQRNYQVRLLINFRILRRANFFNGPMMTRLVASYD